MLGVHWIRVTKLRTTVMPQSIQFEVEMPGDLARFRLPAGVQDRLQELLDKQDGGTALSPAERREAEGSDLSKSGRLT